ncbi:ribosome maturation factor RimM [Paraoerskovia sediminicola]|uniref:Ribosome maturation factor RimM n=1 Tax=Paraoerskovia sediminicola TaxID=1138587 RepID=A0ABM8G715_9CELL|nr:ribosome maturation factor RimM [Paraoerskovia sediminicola]BDZ43947.1 ribosome maturation factor RimM [Paraoerskovia sediminicola]
MRLTVARIGKAHGLRGEVSLQVRTDDPSTRFAVGAELETDPGSRGPLTVATCRNANGRWFVGFAGISDRTAAESLRGTDLVVEVEDERTDAGEDDAWYEHELAGLCAELEDGTVVGRVAGLENAPAHDLLVVEEPGGARTLVPFVTAIVPVVDVAGGRVVLTPPGGLLASDAARLEVSDETSGGAGRESGD